MGKMWKKRGLCLALGISIMCSALSGCGGSIIRDASLNYTLYKVEPLKDIPNASDNKAFNKDEIDLRKYQVGGTDAFYILPVHRPAPDNILKFQVLDVIDGTTTIYAYQALIDDSEPAWIETPDQNQSFFFWNSFRSNPKYDWSGLSGTPKSGKAVDTLNYKGQGWPGSKKTVSVLMSYNVVTKEYKVFQSFTAPLDKTMARKLDEKGTQTYGVSASASDEIYGFVAQKLAADKKRYFFYINSMAYVYDEKGNMTYKKDVAQILQENKEKYGNRDKNGNLNSSISLLNIVMDKDYFMYMTMMLQSKNTKVDENATEEQLENEGADLKQIQYTFFETSMGAASSNYFISENLNYQKHKDDFMSIDGKEIYLDADERERDVIDSPSFLHLKWPQRYGGYIYNNPDLPFELCITGKPAGESMNDRSRLYLQISDQLRKLLWQEATPGNYVQPEKNSYYYTGYLKNSSNLKESSNSGVRFYLEDPTQKNNQAVPVKQEADIERLVRHYTIVRKQSDGTETREQREDTTAVVQRYKCYFSNNTRISYTEANYSTFSIAPSNDVGYLYFGKHKVAQNINLLGWNKGDSYSMTDRTLFLSSGLSKLKNKTNNAFMLFDVKPSTLLAITDKGMYVLRDLYYKDGLMQIDYRYKVDVTNAELNFGIGLEAGVEEILNVVKGGNAKPVRVTSDSTQDLYDANSFFINSEAGNDFLYIGGLTHGLVKLNLNTNLNRENSVTAGQLFSYPCYGIWKNKDQNSCYVVGFQSSDYSYVEEDLPCAKLYNVSLMDDHVASNLVVSCLNKNTELRKDILAGGTNGTTKWNDMVRNLGIPSGSMKRVEIYREFLMDSEMKIQNAVLKFYELARIPAGERTEALREAIRECRYGEDVETLMLQQQSGYKQVEAETKAVDSMEFDLSENVTAAETKAAETKPDKDKSKEELAAEEQRISNEKQSGQVKQYGGQADIRKKLADEANLTDEQWEDAMNEIAFNLQTPDTVEEFLKNRADRKFAQMAGISLNKDVRAKVESCKTVEDLEKQMAEYQLSIQSRKALTLWGDGQQFQGTTPEEFGEMMKRQQEYEEAVKSMDQALLECKTEYMKKSEHHAEYGLQWNANWEQAWTKDLKDILEPYLENS